MTLNNKSNSNTFKFGIYQEKTVIGERIFSADYFNPATRYDVNIRDMIQSIASRLQKTLSKKRVDGKFCGVDTYKLYKDAINSYPTEFRNSLVKQPEVSTQKIGDWTVSGVECKFGLYINNHPIVERKFNVTNYNVEMLQSLDIYYLITEICDEIFEMLKEVDKKHMLDDSDLMRKFHMSIHQIRELPKNKRNELIRRLF